MVPNRVTSFRFLQPLGQCFYLGSRIQEFCRQTAEKSNKMETSRTHFGFSTLCQKCVFSEFQLFVLATFNLTFSTYLTFLRALFSHALLQMAPSLGFIFVKRLSFDTKILHLASPKNARCEVQIRAYFCLFPKIYSEVTQNLQFCRISSVVNKF